MPRNTPQETLEALADRALIYECLLAYFRGLDRGRDPEILRGCFTDDVSYHFEGRTIAHNIEELMAFLGGQTHQSSLDVSAITMMRHFIGNVTIEIDGDVARTETYALAQLIEGEGDKPRLRLRGLRYLDELVRCDEAWRIRDRRHTAEWMTLLDLLPVV